MKSYQAQSIMATALMALVTSTFASSGIVENQTESKREVFQKNFPFLSKISEIRTVPNSSLYEIRSGKNSIYYTDKDASYLIRGELFESVTGTNVTQERLGELNKIDFSSLPLENAIKIVHGNGSKKIATFEDPNCGYCRKYDRKIMDMNNVTVYVFLYPIIGADSMEKSKNIWCSKDKGRTYMDWMLKGEAPKVANCDISAIESNKKFGIENGINGTPFTIFKSGRVVSGAIDQSVLTELSEK